MIKGSRVFRKLGYLSDQQGIINRYLREEGGWDSHLMRSREYILQCVRQYKPRVITILGSGWLLDVPLEELAGNVATVNLVDINHPSQIKRKAGKFKNVKMIEDDITGGLSYEIWQNRKCIHERLAEIEVPLYKPTYDTGLVISLNLLTQLDLLLVDYLVNSTSLNHSEYRDFRKRVQERHIEFLQSNDSILISDIKENIYKDNILVSSSDLLYTPFPSGTNIEEWDWEFDTAGLYYSGKKVVFNVKATEIVNNGKQ